VHRSKPLGGFADEPCPDEVANLLRSDGCFLFHDASRAGSR
jgi:hypothetical protein